MQLKVIGHQWYWVYEFIGIKENEFSNINFESHLEKNIGPLRLLEVDKRLYLPAYIPINFLVTSTDVLHSFCISSLGLKIDCGPGRINVISQSFDRVGVFYGQCSELCGSGHAFMPIVIEVVTPIEE